MDRWLMLFLVLLQLYVTLFHLVDTSPMDGTPLMYGTWEDRKRQRECKSYICQYRRNNCTNSFSSACMSIGSKLSANGCPIRMCKELCAVTPPGGLPNYVEVYADSCPLGQSCYEMTSPGMNTTPMSTSTTSTSTTTMTSSTGGTSSTGMPTTTTTTGASTSQTTTREM